MSESNFDIAALMAKPVWQMSGEEFVQLADYALSSKPSGTPSEPLYVYGIQALAAYIGCCPSTIYELKKNGVRVTMRRKMGENLSAACGQLRRKYVGG